MTRSFNPRRFVLVEVSKRLNGDYFDLPTSTRFSDEKTAAYLVLALNSRARPKLQVLDAFIPLLPERSGRESCCERTSATGVAQAHRIVLREPTSSEGT